MKAEAAAAQPPPVPTQGAKAKLPRLPAFNEQCDNMDAYLKIFERFAESAGGIVVVGLQI